MEVGRFLGADSFTYSKKGYRSYSCKKCKTVEALLWMELNKDKRRQFKRDWREKNKERRRHVRRARYERLRDTEEYKAERCRAFAKRRALKKSRTPQLTDYDKYRIELLYKWAQELPGDWHVDHVIPLSRGGLHHPDNLQLIPAHENQIKSTKLPEEYYGRFTNFMLGK